jgi:hypothetical protein
MPVLAFILGPPNVGENPEGIPGKLVVATSSLRDMAELLLADDIVRYQAMLLSLDETTREEFNAWLKSENLRDEVKGKPDALKKRLLEKFRVRKSLLERVNFVTQPCRTGKRLVVELLERKRIYIETLEEMMKNREKLFVEAALQLLKPEDRADYCNLHPEEEKRKIADLIEFVRRKEEELLREKALPSLTKKKKKNEEEEEEERLREKALPTLPKKKQNEDEDQEAKKKNFTTRKKTRAEEFYEQEEKEERDRLLKEGRCFICHEPGHLAVDCPDNVKNRVKKKNNEEAEVLRKSTRKKEEERRGSDANSF